MKRIAPIPFKGLREAMQAFSDGCLVTVVYDLPLLAGQLDATGGGKGGIRVPGTCVEPALCICGEDW